MNLRTRPWLPRSLDAAFDLAVRSEARGLGQDTSGAHGRAADLLPVRVFLAALAALLVGYMFMGRGFAHLGVGRLYAGEVVLGVGAVATAWSLIRRRATFRLPPIAWLLVAFMVLGAVRTVPYLGTYGLDALRDAVLWGYAVFALMVYLLVDRAVVARAVRAYAWIVPIFAIWLPISWVIFTIESQTSDPNAPGSFYPLVFFKATDMAAHAVGAVGLLVLGTVTLSSLSTFVWRVVAATPLAWTAFITGTASRAALLSSIAGYGAVAVFTRRARNWLPIALAIGVVTVGLLGPGVIGSISGPGPSPTPTVSSSPGPSGSPPPPATPAPTEAGRAHDPGQVIENLVSVFSPSSIGGLEGTKQFRLAWWKAIVKYTAFGPYFWTGKGFGINLADADGFQPTADHSLRAPHNSHLSVLARMGVPGFVLWVVLQAWFALGLLRAVLGHRRAGDAWLALVGSWVLVYWTAMMVITSFDPYLEGPQGGIWFWALFGVGLVVMRPKPRRATV